MSNLTLHVKYFLRFLSENDKLDNLKNLKLLPPKAKEVKKLLYKGMYSNKTVECDVKGYLIGRCGIHTLIIDLNGINHPIHPDYLRDMQKSNFSLNS